MADLRWVRAWRDARVHRARTGLVIAALATGLFGAGAVLDTWALLRTITVTGFAATRPPTATLTLDAVTPSALAAVRALPTVQAAEARSVSTLRGEVDGASVAVVLVAADNLAAHATGVVIGTEGAWPPADSALVVEQSSVEFAGVRVGSRVRLIAPSGTAASFPITGIARDGALPPGWMEHVLYLYARPDVLRRLGMDAAPTELRLRSRDTTADRAHHRAVAAQAAAAVSATGATVRQVLVPIPGRHEHAAQMDSLLATQGGFALLLLVLAAFLVVNLLAAVMASEARPIAVLKALGASDAALARPYLGTAAALGLVAAAIALPLAAVAARAYADFAASLLNFELGTTAIPWWAWTLEVAVALLLPVAAAWVPVRRGLARPVAEALWGHAGGAVRGVVTTAAPRPWLLPVRNARRAPLRSALTLSTLAVAGATFLGALNLRASIARSIDHVYGTVIAHDATVRFARRLPDSVLLAVARAAGGVAQAEAWVTARAAVVGVDALPREGFGLTAVPAASTLAPHAMTAGSWLADGDTLGLVVTRAAVEADSALAPGRTVTLRVAGVERPWVVRGTVDGGPWPAAWTSRAALERVTGAPGATVLAVRATSRDTTEPLALVDRLRTAADARGLEVQQSNIPSSGRAPLEDHLKMVASFLGGVAVLMLFLGGLALASALALSVVERTRELGVLKALGASHRRIATLVAGEALAISLGAWLVALPLSLPLSAVLAEAFGRVMFPVPVSWVPAATGVTAWLVLAVLVGLGAALWPARRALHASTAQALAWE